jgi:HSP20 family protein
MAEKALERVNGASPQPAPTDDEARAVALTPRVDILETDDELLVFADMPGVTAEDVDIRFENGELSVHGRRQPGRADKGKAAREFGVTSYFRSFRVTEQIAADRIEAELKNGVLTLHLPKVEAVKPRRIAVKG